MSTGPLTKDTTTVALGLAQIRIGASAANIGSINSVLTSGESIGALANTKFMSEKDYFTLESGFPLLEDDIIPIREKSSLECAFKEITPYNMAMAQGENPSSYTLVHSGEITLGTLTSPAFIRMEAHYTFPVTDYEMHIIFPRAKATSPTELDLQAEENVNVPITYHAKRADSATSGGNAVWDDMPLGRIEFIDNS